MLCGTSIATNGICLRCGHYAFSRSLLVRSFPFAAVSIIVSGLDGSPVWNSEKSDSL
jgi:hypothetical protein